MANLYSFSEDHDLTQSLRAFVLQAQDAAIERHQEFRVAVSGGSLPKTLARALFVDDADDKAVQWSKWHMFYADERCVPLDHEDSNHRLVKEEILSKISDSSEGPTVYPIDTKYLEDIDELADQYEQTLVKVFATRDSVRLPMFDLLLLGCGPDGHTCSLFPGSPLLRETAGWVHAVADSPKPPPKRITLSMPTVQHGIKIGFVATGGGKKDIMRKIFDEPEGKELPCGLINQAAGDRVSWFTDKPAVEGVKYSSTGPVPSL